MKYIFTSYGIKKNLLKLSLFIFFALVALSPVFVSAQFENDPEGGINQLPPTGIVGTPPVCNGSGLAQIICNIQELLNSLIPLLLALGMVYFVWGVVSYVIADGEEAKKQGRDRMIYGIIGFAVILSVWGLVRVVVDTFGLSSAAAPVQPTGSCTLSRSNVMLGDLFTYITCYIGRFVIPFIFSLALVTFVWGVVQFVINTDEEAKKAKGKQFMIWGIIALTVMVSVWSLVGILGSTFNLDTSILPKVRTQASP